MSKKFCPFLVTLTVSKRTILFGHTERILGRSAVFYRGPNFGGASSAFGTPEGFRDPLSRSQNPALKGPMFY